MIVHDLIFTQSKIIVGIHHALSSSVSMAIMQEPHVTRPWHRLGTAPNQWAFNCDIDVYMKPKAVGVHGACTDTYACRTVGAHTAHGGMHIVHTLTVSQ